MAAESFIRRESIVAKFASLLGTNNAAISRDVAGHELMSLISSFAADSDVVCKLPCLDLRSIHGGSLILPKVGEHHHKPQEIAPSMDASLLAAPAGAPVKGDTSPPEQTIAENLGAPTFWTKSTLPMAASTIEHSLSSSFINLVNSRIREWTLLLLRQSLNAGNYASRSLLLGLLSATSELKSASLTFRTLELPESARNEPKEFDVVLPLLFRADLKIGILKQTEDLTLDAPGTISGNFTAEGSDSEEGLSLVEIQLNTNTLLDTMVDKARLLVSRAVAAMTRTATDMSTSQHVSILHSASQGSLTDIAAQRKRPEPDQHFPPTIVEERSLSPRIQKIKSTAMRFSEVLEGKPPSRESSFDSNQAPTSILLPSSKVELRSSQTLESTLMMPPRHRSDLTRRGTGSKLKSFQSFGRPHGSDHQSFTGNATFANFGYVLEPTWGRDGKLRRHPVPQHGGEMPKYDSFSSGASASSKNAMFPSSPSSSADSVQLLSTHRPGAAASASAAGRNEPKISRTATALESWLMDSSKWSS